MLQTARDYSGPGLGAQLIVRYPAPRPQLGTRGSFPPSEGLSVAEIVVGLTRPASPRAGVEVIPARTGRFVRVVMGLGAIALVTAAFGAEDRHGYDGDDPDDDPDDEEGADDGHHCVVHG